MEPKFEEMLASPQEMMRISAVWVLGEIAVSGRRQMLEKRFHEETSNLVKKKIVAVIRKIGAMQGGV